MTTHFATSSCSSADNLKGIAAAEVALTLRYIWKAALHALPEVPQQEDIDLLNGLARETPLCIEAWWERYQGMVPSWREAEVFEDRALHLVLLADPTISSHVLKPATDARPDPDRPFNSVLSETLYNM